MAAAAAPARTLEQVTKENEALEKELADLRAALGLDRKEAEEEKARVLAIFNKYDVDRRGTIDRAKFDLLAYEAGVGAEALDEKGVSEIFASIAPKDPTAVTFDEFNAWFAQRRKKTKAGEKKSGALAAAAKLQSRVLLKNLESSKGSLRAAKAKVPAERKADRADVKAAVAEAREGVRVRFQVGEFKDAKTGFALQVSSDATNAANLRRDCEVPAGKGSFAFVDLALIAGADEGKLGELAGVLEGLLGALGAGLNEKAGIPIYHGHTVKIARDKDGANVLRIAFFADINPTELLAAQLGREPSVFNPAGLLDLRIALETPLSVALLKDDAARLSLGQILARFTIDGSIASSLDRRVVEAATGMLPEEKTQIIGAGIRLFKGLNIDVQTITLTELAGKFTTELNRESLRQPHEFLRAHGEMLESLPLKAIVEGNLAQLAGMGAELPAEVQGIYNLVRSLLSGPKRVHAQVDDLQVELAFTGFDIFQFAPALGTA